MKTRIGWGALISAMAHGGLLWWLVDLREPQSAPVRLELVLLSDRKAAGEPQAQTSAVDVEPRSEAEPALPERPASVDPLPRTEPEAVPPKEETRLDAAVPRPRLNLTRPREWEGLIEPVPEQVLPFNRALAEGIEARRWERRRRLIIDERVAVTYGLADDRYTREGPQGTVTKHDGACITLVENPGVEAGTRWWSTPCRDTAATPFSLPPLDYDGVGRLLPGPVGLSIP